MCVNRKKGGHVGLGTGRKQTMIFIKRLYASSPIIINFKSSTFSTIHSLFIIMEGGCLWGEKSRIDSGKCWFKSIIEINAGEFLICNCHYLLKFFLVDMYECHLFVLLPCFSHSPWYDFRSSSNFSFLNTHSMYFSFLMCSFFKRFLCMQACTHTWISLALSFITFFIFINLCLGTDFII